MENTAATTTAQIAAFSISVLQDVTPMLALAPRGPFGVLVASTGGDVYGVEVLPYTKQWQMDVVAEFGIRS